MTLQDILALGAGILLGCLFALLKLPVPAPTTLGGILGVVGVALGASLTSWLLR